MCPDAWRVGYRRQRRTLRRRECPGMAPSRVTSPVTMMYFEYACARSADTLRILAHYSCACTSPGVNLHVVPFLDLFELKRFDRHSGERWVCGTFILR